MTSTEEHYGLDPAIENRMFGRYADAECIVISAFTELDQDLNLLRKCGVSNHKLRNTISRSGYRFAPVWAGFVGLTVAK